jgi:hypothetical protein
MATFFAKNSVGINTHAGMFTIGAFRFTHCRPFGIGYFGAAQNAEKALNGKRVRLGIGRARNAGMNAAKAKRVV